MINADYLISQVSRLSASQLAATAQQHIELGELMLKLSRTLEKMTALELAEHLPVLLKIPPKRGRPLKPEAQLNQRRVVKRKFKKDILAWMKQTGRETATVDEIAIHFAVDTRAVYNTIRFATYGPPAWIVDGVLVLGERAQQAKREFEESIAGRQLEGIEGDDNEQEDGESESQFDERLADKIHALISAEGSLPVEVIAARLHEDRRTVAACCRRCEWFTATTQGDIAIAMVAASAGGED